MTGMELDHVDVDQTLMQAGVEKCMHIELPEKYQGFPGQISLRDRSGVAQLAHDADGCTEGHGI